MSPPVRICFIAPKAYPLFVPSAPGPFGGAEVDLYLLATELAKDPSFEVSFLVADYGQPPEERIENVRIINSVNFRHPSPVSAVTVWRAMKRAGAQIYFFETASPGVPLGRLFCGLHRCRFVYRTAHEWECDGTWIKDHPLWGRWFADSLRRADWVITQNESDRANLKRTIGVDSTVLPNACRLAPPTEGPRDLILWVGRSASFKHPERFIELARRFPQESFVMICRRATGDDQFERLERQAASVPNLRFIGGVEFRQSDEWFARARVYVNTSDSEGFANTFVQAARAGAAILSWRVNPDQFLTQWQCGLECGGDMDQLARGLSFLLENHRYAEIGQNGRTYCRRRHDISLIINSYKESFRRMAGSSGMTQEPQR